MSPILLDLVADTGATFTTTVVIAGMGIVFLMLVLLIIIFYLFGKIVSGAEGRSKKKSSVSVQEAVEMPLPSPVRSAAVSPRVDDGIGTEVVAAIAAAVAMQEGCSNAVITSIRKVNIVNVPSRNPWAAAAVSDNTRSF